MPSSVLQSGVLSHHTEWELATQCISRLDALINGLSSNRPEKAMHRESDAGVGGELAGGLEKEKYLYVVPVRSDFSGCFLFPCTAMDSYQVGAGVFQHLCVCNCLFQFCESPDLQHGKKRLSL